MAYCTQADLLTKIDESELIQATDDDDLGVVNAANVTAAIEAADAEINGYLAERYSVPLDPVPAVLKVHAIDMAIYHVYLRRLGPPEHREKQYTNCVNFLRLLAKGDVGLGVGDPDGSGSDNTPEFEGPGRTFSRESMKGF